MREVVCRSTRNYMELPSPRAFWAWWIRISEILKSHDWSRIPKFPWKPARSRSETERPRAGELEMAQTTTAKNGDVFFPEFTTNTLFGNLEDFSIFPLVNPIGKSSIFGNQGINCFFLEGSIGQSQKVAGTNESRPPQDCARERWTWGRWNLSDLGHV